MHIIPRDFLMIIVGLSSAVGGLGFALGSTARPEPTELQMAQTVSGDKRVRLIGSLCGENGQTILGVEEDEFWEAPCKEIRVLRDE